MPEPRLPDCGSPPSLSNSATAARGITPTLCQNCMSNTTVWPAKLTSQPSLSARSSKWKLTHCSVVLLLARPRSAHCVGLSSSRLPICQQRHIIALNKRIDTVLQVFPDTLLVDIFPEDAVEHEYLSTLCAVNCYARRCRHMNHLVLPARRDRIVARVGGLERRTNAYSCHQNRVSKLAQPRRTNARNSPGATRDEASIASVAD